MTWKYTSHAARESFPVMRSGSVGCSGVEDMIGEGMWVVVGWKDVVGYGG